jgi:hypothetical protein
MNNERVVEALVAIIIAQWVTVIVLALILWRVW